MGTDAHAHGPGAGRDRTAAGPTWFGASAFPAATDPFSPAVAVARERLGDGLVDEDGPAATRSRSPHCRPARATPARPRSRAAPASTRDPVVANAPTGDAVVAWVDGPQSLAYSLRQAPGGFASAGGPDEGRRERAGHVLLERRGRW